MSILAAHGLSVGYGPTIVATGIELSLEAGTVTCLLGPNGVGKTTLFKTLLGLIPAVSGAIRIGAEDLSQLSRATIARRIAYVPQAVVGDFAYTVLDLVVMGRTAHLGAFGTPTKTDIDVAMQALDWLGITALADRDANRISGGQRQLALIARALAQQAGIIVMDEPTASLDLANRVLVLRTVKALVGEKLAILLSTHEPEHALEIADNVAVMGAENHFETGHPNEVLTSAHLTRLYGTDLIVEETPSGRRVVSPSDRQE